MSSEKDTIYRQDAIDAVSKGCQEWRGIFGRCEENILALPSAQTERELELDGTESNIEILSELRSMFNCFDEAEEPVYRALSDAICALSAQPERDMPKRVLWTGWKGDKNTRYKCPCCKKRVWSGDKYCRRCGQKLIFPIIFTLPHVQGEKQETIVRWVDDE